MNNEYQTEFKKQPLELVDMIKDYIGNGITRNCNECMHITPLDDWLVQQYYHVCSNELIREEDFCPICYTCCEFEGCNTICKDLENMVECDDDEVKTYCMECYDCYSYHCAGCNDEEDDNERKCGCDNCSHWHCGDCENIFCDDCVGDGYIYYCFTCEESFCCRKFYKMGDGELHCEKCIEPVLPQGMISNC